MCGIRTEHRDGSVWLIKACFSIVFSGICIGGVRSELKWLYRLKYVFVWELLMQLSSSWNSLIGFYNDVEHWQMNWWIALNVKRSSVTNHVSVVVFISIVKLFLLWLHILEFPFQTFTPHLTCFFLFKSD